MARIIRRNKQTVVVERESSDGAAIGGIWTFFALMYMFSSDTVDPIGKLEFFWRILAGPFNFLGI